MLEVRYVSDHSLREARGHRLLAYLLEQAADEFSIRVLALRDTPAPFADAFEDELGPFEQPPAPRRVLAGDSLDAIREVRRWTFDAVSLARLASFLEDGLFASPAGPDGWLEDLTIYRDGELVLGLATAEQEGVLRLTRREHAEVAALGIASTSMAGTIRY